MTTIGLTEEQAVALATTQAQAMSSTPVAILRVETGLLGAFETGTYDVGRHVWAVSFRGTFPAVSCGPAPLPGTTPHPCPPPNTSMALFLDYSSGSFVMSETPAYTGSS